MCSGLLKWIAFSGDCLSTNMKVFRHLELQGIFPIPDYAHVVKNLRNPLISFTTMTHHGIGGSRLLSHWQNPCWLPLSFSSSSFFSPNSQPSDISLKPIEHNRGRFRWVTNLVFSPRDTQKVKPCLTLIGADTVAELLKSAHIPEFRALATYMKSCHDLYRGSIILLLKNYYYFIYYILYTYGFTCSFVSRLLSNGCAADACGRWLPARSVHSRTRCYADAMQCLFQRGDHLYFYR